ncbi:MAG TPA: tripartite tricarboxylate transporter substrate binding protein [Alcaligenes sp.]|nr:tripartite tricarboxylate transporter substrate binding protein [Alcaligenes sp.]HRL26674.1 tripartite tricarboxylate transporter substrate binding protein [Alcaligenes sp.]
MKLSYLFRSLAVCAALAPVAAPVMAAETVTLVVSSAAGGPLDVLGRMLAREASATTGQTIVVENRAGASGTIAAETVGRSKPDGNTLLLTLDTVATANPHIYLKSNFRLSDSLELVSLLGTFDQVLVVPSNSGIKTAAQFLKEAGDKRMNYGSAGIGSPGHLMMSALTQDSGIKLDHIPYKSNPAVVNDMYGGRIDSGFLVIAGVLGAVREGKLTALAVSGNTRNSLMPDVPTVAESKLPGLENFDERFAYLVFAPKGTPAAKIQSWNTLLADIMKRPSTAQTLRTLDIQPYTSSTTSPAQWVQERSQRWKRIIEKEGIRSDG